MSLSTHIPNFISIWWILHHSQHISAVKCVLRCWQLTAEFCQQSCPIAPLATLPRVLEVQQSAACTRWHEPLVRYVKLQVAHAPEMLFPKAPRVSDPDMHHGTCVTHVPWWMPGSLTSGFFWSRWRGKCSRHSRGMGNPQFYVSGKRPMVRVTCHTEYRKAR